MTETVRRTIPRKYLRRYATPLAWVWLCAALSSPLVATEIGFRHYFADAELPGKNWGQLEVADLDGDRRPDIIVGQSHWGNADAGIYWYRNTGRADRWEPRVRIGGEMLSDCGMFAADVDGDGRIDIISSSVWYRNPGVFDGKRLFDRFVYDKELAAIPRGGAHDVIAARLEDGGGLSVITQHGGVKTYKGFHLYTVPADPTLEWKRIDLARVAGQHGAVLPRGIGDLNGDGRSDVVYIDRWLENRPEGWKEHKNIDFWRTGKFGACARAWVADIDRDGHADIVQADCDLPAPRVAWFHNAAGDGSRWERFILPENEATGGYHSLAVADFDLDGDLDVYVDEMEHVDMPPSRPNDPRMYVWENLDGKGRAWKKHTVFSGAGGHQAQVADLDGDGDPDIVTKVYTAGPGQTHVRISVLENVTRRAPK
jgi:hypothetical protein